MLHFFPPRYFMHYLRGQPLNRCQYGRGRLLIHYLSGRGRFLLHYLHGLLHHFFPLPVRPFALTCLHTSNRAGVHVCYCLEMEGNISLVLWRFIVGGESHSTMVYLVCSCSINECLCQQVLERVPQRGL